LAALSLKLDVVLFVHLYLADMSHFAAANGAYRRHFPAVSPAARACVEVHLPPGCPVMLEVLLPSTVEGEYHGQLHAKSLILTCCQLSQMHLRRNGLSQKPVSLWQMYAAQRFSSCDSCSSFAVAVSKAKAGTDA